MERKLRIELDARPAGADAPVLAAGEHHLLANQVIDVGILEVRLGQQAVGPGERMHPAGEALDEILRPRRSGKRLGCDRLHHRHGVAHPVIELVDQEPLLDLEPLALGDVARDLGGADDRPELVAQWRHGERDIDHAPVLGHPDGLVMVDHLAPAQPRQDLALLVMQLGRDDAGDRLADHLVRRIAENAGRTGVPRGDPALQRLADDGVVGGRDDCREPRQLHVGFAPVGDLDQEIDGTGDPPVAHRSADWATAGTAPAGRPAARRWPRGPAPADLPAASPPSGNPHAPSACRQDKKASRNRTIASRARGDAPRAPPPRRYRR